MQVDSDDRYVEEHGSAGLPKLPIALAILVLVIGVAWYFSGDGNSTQDQAPADLLAPASC